MCSCRHGHCHVKGPLSIRFTEEWQSLPPGVWRRGKWQRLLWSRFRKWQRLSLVWVWMLIVYAENIHHTSPLKYLWPEDCPPAETAPLRLAKSASFIQMYIINLAPVYQCAITLPPCSTLLNEWMGFQSASASLVADPRFSVCPWIHLSVFPHSLTTLVRSYRGVT